MNILNNNSTWSIIMDPQYNDTLKNELIFKKYNGFIIDSVINNSIVSKNSFLVVNNKSEDDFRFDMIDILNESWFDSDFIFIKYESEPVVYKLYKSGYEEQYGKLISGLSESNSSFIINNYPFTFDTKIKHNLSYIDYKKKILYK